MIEGLIRFFAALLFVWWTMHSAPGSGASGNTEEVTALRLPAPVPAPGVGRPIGAERAVGALSRGWGDHHGPSPALIAEVGSVVVA